MFSLISCAHWRCSYNRHAQAGLFTSSEKGRMTKEKKRREKDGNRWKTLYSSWEKKVWDKHQNEMSYVKWWNRTKWTNLKTVIKIWLIHSSITVTEMRQLATLVHRPLLSPSHSFMRLFLPDHWQARSYCFHPGWRVSNQPDFLLMQNKYGSCYEELAIHSNSQTRP